MRLLLWLALTALTGLAAYALAARLRPVSHVLERAIAALLVAFALVLAFVYATALPGVLNVWSLSISALGVDGALLALLLRKSSEREALRAAVRYDLGAPGRLLREIWRTHELASWGLLVGCVAVAVSLIIAWHFPSWSWDCVWYHVPITNLVAQDGALHWRATSIPYLDGYPRAVELLSVWNVVLPGTRQLGDIIQIPFGILGALSVAAFCRRAHASPALSASLGGMWLALPAVALQLHTTHADVAAGALFITACFFLTARRFDSFERWMTFIALGLYLGTKVTGLFHLILLAPLVAFRIATELRRVKAGRGRQLAGIACGLALLFSLGGYTYVRNVAHEGNPFWPAKVRIPVLGTQLPGTLTVAQIAGPPAFFGAPGAFELMLHKWFTPSGNPYPDVREGPFGVLFPYLGLPALLLLALFAPFARERWQELGVVLMAGLAVLVPAAWWGRFVLAVPAAGLVAIAVLHRRLRWRAPRHVLSALAAVLCVASYTHDLRGYRAFPHLFSSAPQADEVALRREANWLWTPAEAHLRDTELRPGDVVTYDSAMSFLGELWTKDLRDRVVYANDDGNDAGYLAKLRKLHPKWVSVRRGGRAARLFRRMPWAFQPLFPLPRSGAVMYRVTSYRF